MISSVIQTLDEKRDKFWERYIFGLNIFHVNKVTDSKVDNLQIEFLRDVCERNKVSANTGSLYDFGNEPEELFGSQKYFGTYELVRIGCYGGKFYDSENWNLFPPLFFPEITSEFINVRDEEDSLIHKIMYSDALALFITPESDESLTKLRDLLNSSLLSVSIKDSPSDDIFSQSGNFIEEAIKLYKLVMITGADADFFKVYSQTVDNFELLAEPLHRITKYVKESSWYKENAVKLVWDDKFSMCLVEGQNN